MSFKFFSGQAVFAAAMTAFVLTTPSLAQSQASQNGLGGISALIGAIAQGAAKSKAQKGWAQTSDPVKACVNTAFSTKNISVEQLVAAGIGPDDQRIAPLISSCNQILSTQLKSNISCNVSNSKGQQVPSICNQVFAKDENGIFSEITRDEFIRRAGNGEKVQIAILETKSANYERTSKESASNVKLLNKNKNSNYIHSGISNTPIEDQPRKDALLKFQKDGWRFFKTHKNSDGIIAYQYLANKEFYFKDGIPYIESIFDYSSSYNFQAPMYAPNIGGYTKKANQAYVSYTIWCDENKYRATYIIYYNGKNEIAKYVVTDRILGYNVVFSDLLVNTFAMKSIFDNDDLSKEFRAFCKK